MIIWLLDRRRSSGALGRRFTQPWAVLAMLLVPTTGALAQEAPLPEPVITWTGEQPAYFRRAYFADDPWGEPLRSRGGPEAERWGFYVLSGPRLWLVVEVDGAPQDTRLCVAWRNPNGESAARPCQPLPTGPARLAYRGPDNWRWPPGRYIAQIDLENSGQQPSAEVTYAIGRHAETAAIEIDAPPRQPDAAPADDDIVPFPWPPPTPTTRTALDRALLVHDATTLGEVARRLTTALDSLGYSDHSFYRAPGGFALATRLEQIEFDGTPKAGSLRWSASLPPRAVFSLSSFLDALFSAPEGHYRVIVFVVSDQAFSTEARPVSQEEAAAWVGGGADRLPESIARTPLKAAHGGSALIYQFRKVGQDRPSVANPDGAEPAAQQLQRSGILAALNE